uniref:Uncharacterized protein n=1 Tax=Arundo donax TaxID=35708 RepID=A0A0A9GM62_ARUDO
MECFSSHIAVPCNPNWSLVLYFCLSLYLQCKLCPVQIVWCCLMRHEFALCRHKRKFLLINQT